MKTIILSLALCFSLSFLYAGKKENMGQEITAMVLQISPETTDIKKYVSILVMRRGLGAKLPENELAIVLKSIEYYKLFLEAR